jgi:hypothetical protein
LPYLKDFTLDINLILWNYIGLHEKEIDLYKFNKEAVGNYIYRSTITKLAIKMEEV